jgi:2-polyprenyl-3-methyl-5-hydroxy-6-metoxy-1,4-benzoquinol methylase
MPDYVDMSIIQADFDRLALYSGDGWDHNSHYHHFLLKHMPLHCGHALEIGCGAGSFARLLAIRADDVLALDLSPQMIRIAKECSKQFSNIDFQVADVLEREFPAERFDCIVSIATIHHLPMEKMLAKMKAALAVNGTLLILDLFQGRLSDMYTLPLAIPANMILKYLKTGRVKDPREVREAWAEHGRRDSYLTIPQIRHLCKTILPGAKIRKHLFWRYSLIWEKTALSQ